MPSRTVGIALVSTGLVTVLSGPPIAPRGEPRGFAPADTVSADLLAEVTMEPIRVVMTRDQRLESVTMEPIRVVIPLDEKKTPPR